MKKIITRKCLPTVCMAYCDCKLPHEEIENHWFNETFHPDCTLEDENVWQEMDVLPELYKSGKNADGKEYGYSRQVLVRDGDYYSCGIYFHDGRGWQADNSWDMHGDLSDYQWKPID